MFAICVTDASAIVLLGTCNVVGPTIRWKKNKNNNGQPQNVQCLRVWIEKRPKVGRIFSFRFGRILSVTLYTAVAVAWFQQQGVRRWFVFHDGNYVTD